MATTVADIRTRTGDEPITMITAYDAPTAELVDDAGIDVVLVGDSMGNVVLGYDSTLPVTMEEIASRTGAVARAVEDALVVADLPFLSVGTDRKTSIENCGRLLKEEDADAIKLECGPHTVSLTEQLVGLGIPVMAHLGLTPQRVKEFGGYVEQGGDDETAAEMLELAREHEAAGAFALVLEHVPSSLAAQITDELSIPTIGIGAGPDCDGQVLVFHDVVGLSDWSPPFAKRFGDARSEMADAVDSYISAVESEEFPPRDESGD